MNDERWESGYSEGNPQDILSGIEESNHMENYMQQPLKKPGMNREWAGGMFFLIIVLVHVLNGFFNPIKNPVASIVVTQLLIAIPAFIYMLCWKENPFRFMRFRKFHIGSFFLVPVFMFCLLPVMGLLNAISMLFSTNVIGGEISDITGGSLWIGLLCVALLPAFVEECTFRGAIYHSLRGARPVRAIILSGLMFGAMHMNFNQFVYATVLGIVMGFLLEATGSIVSTMLLHFCFNANSVILMWLLPKMYELLEKMAPGEYEQAMNTAMNYSPKEVLSMIVLLIPMAAIGGGLAFLLYYCIARLNKRWYYICFLFSKSTKDQRDSYPKPKVVTVCAIIGFAICFAFCVLNELVAREIIHL